MNRTHTCYTQDEMNSITKGIVWILAGIMGLAALITSVIYDWSNIEPGESVFSGPPVSISVTN